MLRNEFYVWLAFTFGLVLLAIIAAIAFLLGIDYGVGLGLVIALLCGIVFGGWNSWQLHRQWEKYQQRLQRRQLPILRRINTPTDHEYWTAVQQAREVVIHWAVDRAESCLVKDKCRDCGSQHRLLKDYPWDPSLHRAGCSAQQVMAQFSEISLAPMVELLQCDEVVFLDRLQGQAREYLIQCIQYALAELPDDGEQAAVLQYIAQEYRRFAEQQESQYGAIELGRKLVQEVEQVEFEARSFATESHHS